MASWGYKVTNGPATWVNQFPIAAGKQQSPIDIVTSEAQYDSSLQSGAPLTPKYTPETSLTLKNTGHSVSAVIKEKSLLSGGPLMGTYRLEQFHLHWGHDNEQGSEHTIDGKTFPSELHLVHWNTERFSSFAEAADKSDGLAVIGVMIKVGEENGAFKTISDNLEKVSTANSTHVVPTSFDPAKLLPSNISDYWTYAGSLTTPPLFESVRWIVLKTPIEFSKAQLEQLRSLKNLEGEHMQDNYRPPLSLHGRQLMASFA